MNFREQTLHIPRAIKFNTWITWHTTNARTYYIIQTELQYLWSLQVSYAPVANQYVCCNNSTVSNQAILLRKYYKSNLSRGNGGKWNHYIVLAYSYRSLNTSRALVVTLHLKCRRSKQKERDAASRSVPANNFLIYYPVQSRCLSGNLVYFSSGIISIANIHLYRSYCVMSDVCAIFWPPD